MPGETFYHLSSHHVGPLQFAYKAKSSTEDAVCLQHLDTPGNSARILFVDFCSTSNSSQKHLLMEKLHHVNICPTHHLLSRSPTGLCAEPTPIHPSHQCLPHSVKHSDDTDIFTLVSDNRYIYPATFRVQVNRSHHFREAPLGKKV